MLDSSISKFHELVPVVESKDPHRLHAAHLQNSTRNTLLWGQTDFSTILTRLTGTESLFRGVRVQVIYPFFITCDSYLDKSIIHWITDKLTTDIHSTLSLLTCQFMRYRSTASVWFSMCLNLRCKVSFDAPCSSDSLRVFFADFLPKLCIYSQYLIIQVFQNVENFLVFFSSGVETLEPSLCHTLTNDTFFFHFTYSSNHGSSFKILFPVVL